MNKGVHQNKALTGGRASGNLVELSSEHSELTNRNHLVISNGNGSVGRSFAEPSRKRTSNANGYGDCKQRRGDVTGSECNSSAGIKEIPNGNEQSFESREQQSLNNLTDACLVSLNSTTGTNGTLDGTMNGLATNGYTANGNGVSTCDLKTISSPLPRASQNPKMAAHKQTVHEVSDNGDSSIARKRTASLERVGPKYKQFETIPVSSCLTDKISTNGIGRSQNLSPNQALKKIQLNIKQKERQSAISNYTSSYKKSSYSYGQASFGNDIQNGHNVKVVDFRSDTCSLPTEGMRDAIYRAEVGDSVYGEDPSVVALEKKSAKLFQKEAACFVPSGTMSNLVAILVHCNRRGSEIITGSKSHILLLEQAGVAQFGGINIREIENNPDGTFSLDELKSKIRVEDTHTPYTSLICVENTHNVLGGKVLPQQWVDELCSYAKSVNLPVHMDGARIFSASTKLNIPVCEITRNVDSVTFCISKNLGAPYGAVLLGTNEFCKQARRVIKALGGGVRQIGFMAAAGLYALDNMVERLSIDHYHVQMIANEIRELNHPHVQVLAPEDIHSNILIIRLNSPKVTPTDFVNMLSTIYDDEEGPVMIKSFAMNKENVRFVLCNNISKSDVEDAIRKVRFVINKIR